MTQNLPKNFPFKASEKLLYKLKKQNQIKKIRGYISTCRKNGQKVMDSLVKAVKDESIKE